MWRRLGYTVSVVSALLATATIAVWVRSYWTSESIIHVRLASPARVVLAATHPGELSLACWHVERDMRHLAKMYPEGWHFGSTPATTPDYSASASWLVFSGHFDWAILDRPTRDDVIISAEFPLWVPVIVLVSLGAVPLIAPFRRRARRRRGLCEKCGYDLRATPDRCPECGTVPPGRPDGRL